MSSYLQTAMSFEQLSFAESNSEKQPISTPPGPNRGALGNDYPPRPSRIKNLRRMLFSDSPKDSPLPLSRSSSTGVTSSPPRTLINQESPTTLTRIRRLINKLNTTENLLLTRYQHEFTEERELGQGSFGTVYLARNKIDNCYYAIKKVLLATTNCKYNEVEILSQLSHPNIIRYHCAWVDKIDNSLYIQMMFCEGGNIKRYMCGGDQQMQWAEEDLWDIMHQVALALEFIHSKGIVHLDVKMENVYVVSYDNSAMTYVLGDFGMACKIPTSEQERNAPLHKEGDSRYLCPSVYYTSKYLKEVDIFALGASIYELAKCQQLPQNVSKWIDHRHDIGGSYSAQLCLLIYQTTDPNPESRPSSTEIVTKSRRFKYDSYSERRVDASPCSRSPIRADGEALE